MDYQIHSHDVVIIGGGLSGLRAAVECLKSDCDVAVISKVHPLRSHSVAAQGGINAALGNAVGAEDDNWEDHAFDTVKGSDYLADQDAVEIMCREAPPAVIELEHLGTVFSRMEDGQIAQRPFGGAGVPRTCYAADRTGHNMLHTLYEQLIEGNPEVLATSATVPGTPEVVAEFARIPGTSATGFPLISKQAKIYEEYFVTSLVVSEGKCVGCTAINVADGTFHGFAAKATVLATGGYGRLYNRSTNAVINTGDGAALALRAGVPLKDMEFVQFHPTTLYGTNILITEGARGEGGYLFNNKRERFMKFYAPTAMDLAPRDIVARAIMREVEAGRAFEDEYVHLDLTHLGAERIKERLPGIRQIAMDFAGIDPIDSPIPVQPGQHYSMGGVASSEYVATPMPGLYAAGECACVSVHGANRLGGNSLLETVVFGKLTGAAIAQALPGIQNPSPELVKFVLKKENDRIDSLLSRKKGERLHEIRDELKRTMFDHFGVFREEESMKIGLDKIRMLKERFANVYIGNTSSVFNQALIHALELEMMLDIAEPIALGAIERRESRGSHSRTDYPERDDERFLVHTLAHYRDGKTELEYSPVTLGKFPVKERVY